MQPPPPPLRAKPHSSPPKVPRFLGVTVGLIQADMDPEARRAAYASGITYVTNSELGFDYLRDNLAGVSARLCCGAGCDFWCGGDAVQRLLQMTICGQVASGCSRVQKDPSN
jgi:hypothetical protein